MKRYIVGMGEVLWDVLPEGRKLGGAPANFSYHVSQFGLKGCVISAVGHDKLGDEIISTIKDKNLNYIIPKVEYPTGTVEVTLDEAGVPQYAIRENVAWDNIPFNNEIKSIAHNTRAFCFGSLAQRCEASRSSILKFLDAMPEAEDVLKVFDINLRQNFYNKEIICESLERCNVLKINDEELDTLSSLFGYTDGGTINDKCRRLLKEYDLKMLILTCGTNGSYVFTSDNVSFQPTPKVDVADTVGAGDSFTAAFIASIVKGSTVEEAHKKAADVSAYVCSQNGAMPPLPVHLTKQCL